MLKDFFQFGKCKDGCACRVAAVVLNCPVGLEAARLFEKQAGATVAADASVGAGQVWNKPVVPVYVIEDQVVPANSPEISEQQQEMAAFARSYGCEYVYGQAMAPHYLLNGRLQSGQVVIGSDPDLTMLGAVGSLGIALPATQLCEAMATGTVEMPVVQEYVVCVRGELPDKLDIRNAAQQLVHELADKIKKHTVLEIYCESLLTLDEKMLLCGWSQRLGHLSTLIVEEKPAHIDYVLRLDKLQAAGSSTDVKLVNAVYIGGSYGGNLEAIRQTARLVAGQQIAYKVRLSVAPASAEIYAAAASAGYLTAIIEAGGMILNQCALPPVQARIGEGEVLVSNDSHAEPDYAGVGGTVYLTSTKNAVEAALTGKVGVDKLIGLADNPLKGGEA